MSTNSNIEWTEATWNPIRGCTRVSEGCRNCYAERVAMRFSGSGKPYEGLVKITNGHPQWTGKVRFVEEHLADPLKWEEPRRIFVNSMSDLFHEGLTDDQIDSVFAIMAMAKHHVFQVLTKRPKRMLEYFSSSAVAWEDPERHNHQPAQRSNDVTTKIFDLFGDSDKFTDEEMIVQDENWPLPNVWTGVSCENQKAKERIDILRETPAAVRMLSLEPLLEDLGTLDLRGIHWVIVGGESGPGARPMHPDWARSLRDQCKAAGVPFFFKQWGEYRPTKCDLGPTIYLKPSGEQAEEGDSGYSDSQVMRKFGKKAAGRLLDGVEHSEYPLQLNQCNCSGAWHSIGSTGCTLNQATDKRGNACLKP